MYSLLVTSTQTPATQSVFVCEFLLPSAPHTPCVCCMAVIECKCSKAIETTVCHQICHLLLSFLPAHITNSLLYVYRFNTTPEPVEVVLAAADSKQKTHTASNWMEMDAYGILTSNILFTQKFVRFKCAFVSVSVSCQCKSLFFFAA